MRGGKEGRKERNAIRVTKLRERVYLVIVLLSVLLSSVVDEFAALGSLLLGSIEFLLLGQRPFLLPLALLQH